MTTEDNYLTRPAGHPDGSINDLPPVDDSPITTLFLRSVPKEVKRQFKSWCADNDITMTDKLVQMMKATYAVRGNTT